MVVNEYPLGFHGAEWVDPVEQKEREILVLKKALHLMAVRLEQEMIDFSTEINGYEDFDGPTAKDMEKFFIERAEEAVDYGKH